MSAGGGARQAMGHDPETPAAHSLTLVMFLHPIRVRQTASASRPAASSLARRP